MTTYEGWSNYPTWAVNLWLANDKRLCAEALGVVGTSIASVKPEGRPLTPEQATLFDVEDALKDWVEGLLTFDGPNQPPAIKTDLIAWTLGQVNWRELTEEWIRKVQEVTKP